MKRGDSRQRPGLDLHLTDDAIPITLGVIGHGMTEGTGIDGRETIVHPDDELVLAGSKLSQIEFVRGPERIAGTNLFSINPDGALPVHAFQKQMGRQTFP